MSPREASGQGVRTGDWRGLLAGRRATTAEVQLAATLGQGSAGGAGAFLGLADDGRRYWIKTLNNRQGDRVPITEQIVGRVGSLFDAPTCDVKTIAIGDAFAGWEFCPGQRIEPGMAHGSLLVADAVDTSSLNHQIDDDNARRHAALCALYDWCWGGDLQGLLAVRDENRFYSHDHGWYLPPEGASWTIAELEARVDDPHELPMTGGGIPSGAGLEIAAALEGVGRAKLQRALASIPATWPVTDEELERVGFFLERRAVAVARRIRNRFRGTP